MSLLHVHEIDPERRATVHRGVCPNAALAKQPGVCPIAVAIAVVPNCSGESSSVGPIAVAIAAARHYQGTCSVWIRLNGPIQKKADALSPLTS
eukprot:329290-Amphidinium_carterae.1